MITIWSFAVFREEKYGWRNYCGMPWQIEIAVVTLALNAVGNNVKTQKSIYEIAREPKANAGCIELKGITSDIVCKKACFDVIGSFYFIIFLMTS